MKISTKVLAIGLTGLMAVGVAGVTFAQGPANPDRPASQGLGAGDHRGARIGLAAIVQASGLDKAVFSEGLKAGQSINQVLTDNGKDPAAIQAQVLAELRTRLDQAVADGKLTEERADQAYAKAQEQLPAFMNSVPDGSHGGGQDGQRRGGGKGLMKSAAETIGIEIQALVEQVKAGQTIAAVATAHNVAPQTVIDNAVAAANARIDQAVADGKLTPEAGATVKEKVAARIT
ncbi:MAG: hypothetical protein ACKVT1_01320, partial [Dehalococcoidia bacterium]